MGTVAVRAVQQPSRAENSKIEQPCSHFMVFDGDWRNVLFVRRSKNNMLVCMCSRVQDLALCATVRDLTDSRESGPSHGPIGGSGMQHQAQQLSSMGKLLGKSSTKGRGGARKVW